MMSFADYEKAAEIHTSKDGEVSMQHAEEIAKEIGEDRRRSQTRKQTQKDFHSAFHEYRGVIYSVEGS